MLHLTILQSLLKVYIYLKCGHLPICSRRTSLGTTVGGCRPHRLDTMINLEIWSSVAMYHNSIRCSSVFSDAKTLTWSFGVEDYNTLGL